MVFEGSRPIISKLIKKSKVQNFPKGHTITASNDLNAIFIIKKGFVKRFQITNKGSISTHGIYGPGDLFGVMHLFKILTNQQIYTGNEVYYYEPIDQVQLYKITSENLLEAAKSNKDLYKDILSALGPHYASDIWLLENQGLSGSTHRVAHLILFYIQQYGKRNLHGWSFKPPLTHQDIADILKLSRESVSLAISELRKNKIIRNTTQIIVPDLGQLKSLAYS